MKKITMLVTALLLCCIVLPSCKNLRDSVSGDIINPVDGFSRGNDEGTLVFKENNYILIDEIRGNFSFDITDQDVFLGETSNFPFFPNFGYYANEDENADYIASGSLSDKTATMVFLREDLYQKPIRYVLQGTDYEFIFSSAFIKTEEVSYKTHIEGEKHSNTKMLNFHLKEYPRLTVFMHICKIDEKWYYVEYDEAFVLSESFVNDLVKNQIIDG
jgi:hypothetical protein